MNFRFLFLALSLVAGGNALRFGAGAKNVVKEHTGIDLLAVCADVTAVKNTMVSQGCFNVTWNATILHDQLVTMCANCDAPAAYTILKDLSPACLETDTEFVLDVALAAASCVNTAGTSDLCAEPIVREIHVGADNKTQAMLETACGTSCHDLWATALKANSALCLPDVDMSFLNCLKDENIWCSEYLSNEALYDDYADFCATPCAGKFYDQWTTISSDKGACYENGTETVDGDNYCRTNATTGGTNCLDMIKTYAPDPVTTCNTEMSTSTSLEWSYCNGTCKTAMETMFTDLGCCAETFVFSKLDGKYAVAATKWLKETCSVAAADTACPLVYTASTTLPPTTAKPVVLNTTVKPVVGNATDTPKNVTKVTPTSDTKTPCDKCDKEGTECEKIDDCFAMIMGCYAEVNTEKFTKCVKPLGFDESSAGFHEAVKLLECHYCKCEDDKAAKDICKGYAEPTPEDTTPSAANKIALTAVMFVVSLSTLKFF